MKKYEMYFITDNYFIKFQDPYLMKNIEVDSNDKHNRPCYYIFSDNNNKDIFWMIPISSKVEKYKKIT